MTGQQRKQPQDHRPSLAKKHTRSSKAKRDEELDRGIAFTDVDGKRLAVRLGDVRGSHDRRLRQEIGLDFVGLMDALLRSQGTDLLAAAVWFARLVNDHNTEQTLDELLEEFSYERVEAAMFDDAAAEDGPTRPEA